MRFVRVAFGLALIVSLSAYAQEAEDPQAAATEDAAAEVVESEEAAPAEEDGIANVDEKATHRQVRLIEIPKKTKVNAFCLAQDGRILAASGVTRGEVAVFDADGKRLDSWKLPVVPQAINVAPDGTVLVAGQGKLIRLSAEGETLQEADAPHAIALRKNSEKLREQAVADLSGQEANLEEQVALYENMLAELTKKKETEELNDQEKQIEEILPAHIERMKKMAAEQADQPEPEVDEKAVEKQMESISKRKLQVASISSDGKHVYVATPALAGYTFDVWRTDADFGDAKVVVSELRGCCGHMDVQACSTGIYVAENARHRVACFDSDGEAVNAWGESDRTGLEGFTSCCNPMNVCFNAAGDVYTAESSTGRIKRFGADGTFKDFVGDVKLVPGCKNVSIAVSDDDSRIYMLDITRNHLVLMERKDSASESAPEAEAASPE